MEVIRSLKPAAALRGYIRFYTQREAKLRHGEALLHAVPARATPVIEFALRDRHKARFFDRPDIVTASSVTIVGLQTHRRAELVMTGDIEGFGIWFQPGGLHQLFSVPMNELTNQDYDARAVLGPSISPLEQRLGECRSFEERARIMDLFLLERALAAAPDAVAANANAILRNSGGTSISVAAHEAGLSLRQFERRFKSQIGMRPKLYARIARFEAALNCKAVSPAKSWMDVAHEFGYHDQMHLIHDFREFSGDVPANTVSQVEAAFRETIAAARLGGVEAQREFPLIL
jgi:AraC-like DNA-binding protein